MSIPEFEFSTVACRDKRVNNCPQVATNVVGVVAVRDSERPNEVVTMSPEGWTDLIRAESQRLGLAS
ncbi:DUF397 domain-containing protein [Streptomyces sp. NRRL WC-3742]|uniref:DUF397 domain-containing protein n=1 Tax=Streptomyces sp. NRRL WC-3742 TaxID=1463934 RepID=UPI0004CC2F0E|nr:DUF397 domain-containing protein [Streptomyces sp. NRRL WC-3742]